MYSAKSYLKNSSNNNNNTHAHTHTHTHTHRYLKNSSMLSTVV